MLFLDVDFFTFLHRFWKGLDLQVGAQLDVLASHDHPKSLSNPIFWQRVSKMLAKRIQKGSQEAPDGDCWRIFIGFGGPGACPPTGFSTLPQVIPTSIPIPIPKKTIQNSTPNRSRIDPESTPNRPQINAESTPNRRRIDPE